MIIRNNTRVTITLKGKSIKPSLNQIAVLLKKEGAEVKKIYHIDNLSLVAALHVKKLSKKQETTLEKLGYLVDPDPVRARIRKR